jgi:hypothetical protein
MNQSDIFTLVQFNYWANERILTGCAHLSADPSFRRSVHARSDT